MKKLLHKRFIILNSITKEEKFKVIYMFSIILALYGSYVLASGTRTMIEATLITFTFPIFNLLFFLLVLLNSYNTYKSFSKEFDSYIIRLKTKRNYLKEIIYLILFSNILLIIMFLLLFFTFLLFFKGCNIGTNISSIYDGIPDIFYMLVYIFRNIIYLLLLVIIIILINYKYNFITSLLIIICFSLSLFLGISTLEITNSFKITPWHYFQITRYGSFSLEIAYSTFYLLLLEVTIFILFNIKEKNKVKIKYILYNDISYFLHNHKYLLGFFAIITIIISIITYNQLLSPLENLNNLFLLNLNLNKYNILNVIYYVLSLAVYTYITISLYVKDLMYGIDNILLRESLIMWLKSKLVSIILITVIVKLIMYVLLILIFYFKSQMIISSVYILFKDLIYTIFIELLFLNTYILLLKNHKIAGIILLISCFLVILGGTIWFNNIAGIIVLSGLLILLIILHKKETSILIERGNFK